MGFFKRKRRKTEEPNRDAETVKDEVLEQIENEPVKVEKEKIDLSDEKARLDYKDRLEEAIREADRQMGDIKFEYGQVTSYLKDIQLIDQAPEEEKSEALLAARRIVELMAERTKLQQQKYKVTDAQKRALENYEEIVDDDIRKMVEYEDYQLKIKEDLRRLAGEKNLLLADKKDIIKKQRMLKTIGKSLTIILIALGAMLAALMFCFKVDITVPFIATVAFGFAIAAIILNEARKNRIDMVITEKKCNRAIFLTNKVKIKYVNNVRTLDYMCHKYQVRNATELDYVYGQYRLAKREWARQRETAVLINQNHEVLVTELEHLGVKDCEIWFTQAKALVEPKEMVEVRHELNVRRQKLREQLDYNTEIIQECKEEMERIQMAAIS